MIRFIKFYFIRQGFRDGLPGLIHIAIGCFNSFIKYSKMLERKALMLHCGKIQQLSPKVNPP
jgi:hypothetical protein